MKQHVLGTLCWLGETKLMIEIPKEPFHGLLPHVQPTSMTHLSHGPRKRLSASQATEGFPPRGSPSHTLGAQGEEYGEV